MNNTKKWLDEISYMRVVLLVLLVSYHAFAPFTVEWYMPKGIYEIEFYGWLGKFCRAFRLEGFIFISGYVYTYQLVERRKYSNFGELFNNKLHRLYIPSLFFSLLYILCFWDLWGIENICDLLLMCINGAGHLWYLPCLFWCFLIQFFLIKCNFKVSYVLLCLFVAILLSIIPFPLRIDRALYYMFFFYGGGLFWKYSKKLKKMSSKQNVIIICFIFFFIFFMGYKCIDLIEEYHDSLENIVLRGGCGLLNTIIKALMAVVGIFALYLICSRYSLSNHPGTFVLKAGSCGYGVYVFHQFILVWLYVYSNLSLKVGIILLPWVSIVITIALSVSLSLIIRQTQIGRKYL